MVVLSGRAPSALHFATVILLTPSLQVLVYAAESTVSYSSSSDSGAIGDYVAEGFGLRAAAEHTSETVSSRPANVLAHGYNATSSASQHESSKTASSITSLEPSVSANGDISSYALSCYSARWTWRQDYDAWYNTAVERKTFSKTTFETTLQFETVATATIYPSNVSTYKLCDGSPRVDASPITLTSTYNWTSTFTTVETLSSPTYTTPPCSMAPKDCMYLYYNTSLSDSDVVLLGACGSPAHLSQPCLIGGGPVRLAYFPVSTTNGDLCTGGGTTITSMDGPSTIEALGTTLTSGSVYLSFQSLYAFQEGFEVRIGPNFTDYILPLPSSAISTQCGGWFSAQGAGTAVNWVDFNYPQPASAYACENRCTTELSYIVVNGTGRKYTPPPECYTIWDDFNPALAVPTEARDLVPEWSTCSFWDDVLPNFLFDPPIALRPADSIATATLPVTETQTTVSASPASTIYTALPETESSTPNPTTTANSESEGSTIASASPTHAQAVHIVFTADSQVFTASAATGAAAHNAFVVNGATVPVDGSAQVVDGHTVSLGLDGIYVDGSSAAGLYSTSLGEPVTTISLSASSTASASSGVEASESSDGTTRSATTTTNPASGSNAEISSGSASSSSTTGAGVSDKVALNSWLLAPAMALLAML